MQLKVWGQTDVGLKRDINQDTILVDKKLRLFVLADGMGGHKGGEVASALAAETVREIIEDRFERLSDSSTSDILKMAYQEASLRIHRKSTQESPELMGMGTTMVVVLQNSNRIYIANVGDSRAYLYSGQNLWQLTEDHSLVNEQVRAGVIREEDAAFMVGRNVITRSVGFEKEVDVDVVEKDLQPGEMIIMCSDGLSGLVPDEKIAEIISNTAESQIVSKLIDTAKQAGGDDNISVILLKAVD